MRLKSFGAVTLIVLLAGASFGQESVKSLRFSDEQISNASGAVDRARLIDQLGLSDGYRSHQFNWLADMVRHKSILKWSQFHYYERWIKDQITANLPWD